MMTCSSPRVPNRGSTLGADEVHLWLVDLDLANGEADDTERHIAPAIDRRLPGSRRERRRVSRRRVREILASYVGRHAQDSPSKQGDSVGLAGSGTDWLSSSVSHSHLSAVLAITKGGRIGVDIEWTSLRIQTDRLIARFFSLEEAKAILAQREEEWEKLFYRTWVRKEAYLKAVGGGVPAGLRRFSVSVAPDQSPAVIDTELEDGGASAFSLYDIDVPEGYVGALAVEGMGHRIRQNVDEKGQNL